MILALSFLRDFFFLGQAGRQRRSPTRGSWLMSGGIASAIFFFLMKSEETHEQPKAGHISCFFFSSIQ